MSAPPAPPDQAARSRIAARPRHHPVRGGRRRLGQDHRAGRPGRGAGHLGRRWSCATSPPSPSPRRRAPSCATACAARCRTDRPTGRRADEADAVPRSRSPSSTVPPSARCTPSPSACCRSTRWRRGSRRGSRCSTRCPRRWPSTGAGRGSSTSSSTIPSSSARSSCCTPPTSTRSKLRSLALAFERVVGPRRGPRARPSAPSRPSRRRPHAEGPRRAGALAAAGGRVHRPHRQAPRWPVARLRRLRASGCAGAGDDDLDLLEALARRCPATAKNAGQGAVVARLQGRRSTRSSPRSSRPSRTSAGPVLDGCAHRLGSALRATTLEAADRRRAGGHPRVPRPARAGPQGAARPGAGPDRAGRASTSATSGCCSTSSRTPTRSRSSWPCASPPLDPAAADEPRWADVDGRARAPVRGRRPEAVDLPVPPRRHLRVHGRPRALRPRGRGRGRAHGQLPHRRTGHRLGERHLPHAARGAPRHRRARTRRSPPTSTCQPQRGVGRRRCRRWRSSAREPHPYGSGADVVRIGREPRRRPRHHHARSAEGWVGATTGDDGWRPCRLGDITILVPARTSLPFLEDALEAAAHPLPGRVELARLRHPRRPRPAHGAARRRRPHRPPPHRQRAAHPAARLRRRRPVPPQGARRPHLVVQHPHAARPRRRDRVAPAWRSCSRSTRPATGARPAELLDRIARDRRALELGFAEGRPRDVWRRLRFVIDQARAWSEATGGSLRAYLHWVDQQTAEGSRVAESVLPETDDDAVRIMTIHAAKGLEFPITIVSGLSARPRRDAEPGARCTSPRTADRSATAWARTSSPRSSRPPSRSTSRWATTSGSVCSTSPAPGPATTSSCRSTAWSARTRPPSTAAAPTPRSSSPAWATRLDGAPRPRRRARARCPLDPATVPAPPPDFDDVGGRARRRARRRPAAPARSPPPPSPTRAPRTGAPSPRSSCRAATAPIQPSLFDGPHRRPARRPRRRRRRPATPEPSRTTVDPGLQKRPRDLDLPPWLKGRYGTAVGRAVHGVLQTIDLATGDGLDDAVAAQCQAEAVPDRADDVRAPGARTRSASPVGAGRRRRRRTGARCTPARRSAIGCSRATSTCSTAATTAWSSSTTRRPATRRPRRARPPGRGLPPPGRRLRGGGRPGHRRARRPGRVPVPHPARRGRTRARRPPGGDGRRRAPRRRGGGAGHTLRRADRSSRHR